MQWNPKGNRYELPPGRRTGPITKLFWALEDWWRFLWRSLNRMDKATIAFVLFALVLWVAIVLFCVPGPP